MDMSHRYRLLASQLKKHGDALAAEGLIPEVPIDPLVPPPLLRLADFVECARPVADLFGSGRQEFLCPLLLRYVFNLRPHSGEPENFQIYSMSSEVKAS